MKLPSPWAIFNSSNSRATRTKKKHVYIRLRYGGFVLRCLFLCPAPPTMDPFPFLDEL
jgi:hypothetical protein